MYRVIHLKMSAGAIRSGGASVVVAWSGSMESVSEALLILEAPQNLTLEKRADREWWYRLLFSSFQIQVVDARTILISSIGFTPGSTLLALMKCPQVEIRRYNLAVLPEDCSCLCTICQNCEMCRIILWGAFLCIHRYMHCSHFSQL